MILYIMRKNTNPKSAAFGKHFAYPVIEETIELDGLAEHMSNHNTPYSKGAIKGMLTDMVGCIKELLLEGKNVKIADLAIFSLGIKNNGGIYDTHDVAMKVSISEWEVHRAVNELSRLSYMEIFMGDYWELRVKTSNVVLEKFKWHFEAIRNSEKDY